MGVPAHFGRYSVQRVLGTGQMGTVYLARDPLIGRTVAIKCLREDPAAPAADDGLRRERFEQEIQISGTFAHPNIVTLYDVGSQEGLTFIAMEYVDGCSLRETIDAEAPFRPERVAELLTPICGALGYAHRKGVVHRDVKPSNILLTADGMPKLSDFGVARLAGSNLTVSGKVFGSPAYMSPEQIGGQRLTGASDQFALAVVAYEMLTGRRPFTGDNPAQVIYRVHHDRPPTLHQVCATVPREVSDVVMRGLRKRPSRRFESCEDFATALHQAIQATADRSTRALEATELVATSTGSGWRGRLAFSGPIPVLRRLALTARLALQSRLASRSWSEPLARALERVARAPRHAWPLAALVALVAVLGWGLTLGDAPQAAGDTGTGLSASLDATGGRSVGDALAPSGDDLRTPTSGGDAAALVDNAAPEPADDTLTAASPAPLPEIARLLASGEPLELTVMTRPAGARVRLDGQDLDGTTPLRIAVVGSAEHVLYLERPGHRPMTWHFSLPALEPHHVDSRQLYFPLERASEVVLDVASADPVAFDLGALPVSVTAVEAASSADDPAVGPAGRVALPEDLARRLASLRRLRAPLDVPMPARVHHEPLRLPEGLDVRGVALVEIEISAVGTVVQARLLRGVHPDVDRAVLDAVVAWQFEPTVVHGEPVLVKATVSVPINR